MATMTDKIISISGGSGSFSDAKAEKEVRARLQNSERRTSMFMKQAQEKDGEELKEVMDAEKAAVAKRKQQQDNDLNELREAQQQALASKPTPGAFLGRAKPDAKPKKMPGFVVSVKKPKLDESSATSAPSTQDAAQDKSPDAPAALVAEEPPAAST